MRMNVTSLTADRGTIFPASRFVLLIQSAVLQRLCLALFILGVAQYWGSPNAGNPLVGSGVTLAACGAILLIGLPHGAFDYHLIKMHSHGSVVRVAALLSVYLILGAMVYILWQISPRLALLMFLAISVAHFSEDWVDGRPDLLSLAPAAAIICLPAMAYPDALKVIFVQLTGDEASSAVADLMMLFAPVAVLLAIVKAGISWNEGDHQTGITLMLIMLAMICFPPVVGFAVYFCLVHSPIQFSRSKADVQAVGLKRDAWLIWPLTFVSMLIAAGIFFSEIRIDAEASAITAVFMTLSILTVPHMAMPFLIRHM